MVTHIKFCPTGCSISGEKADSRLKVTAHNCRGQKATREIKAILANKAQKVLLGRKDCKEKKAMLAPRVHKAQKAIKATLGLRAKQVPKASRV